MRMVLRCCVWWVVAKRLGGGGKLQVRSQGASSATSEREAVANTPTAEKAKSIDGKVARWDRYQFSEGVFFAT
jgi:hypothetical protein